MADEPKTGMVNNLLELVKSKKFKVALFAVLAAVCSALAEKITWVQAGQASLAVVMTYIGAQGIADLGAYLGKSLVDAKKVEIDTSSKEDPAPPKP